VKGPEPSGGKTGLRFLRIRSRAMQPGKGEGKRKNDVSSMKKRGIKFVDKRRD
jgi:hypothetical protein